MDRLIRFSKSKKLRFSGQKLPPESMKRFLLTFVDLRTKKVYTHDNVSYQESESLIHNWVSSRSITDPNEILDQLEQVIGYYEDLFYINKIPLLL